MFLPQNKWSHWVPTNRNVEILWDLIFVPPAASRLPAMSRTAQEFQAFAALALSLRFWHTSDDAHRSKGKPWKTKIRGPIKLQWLESICSLGVSFVCWGDSSNSMFVAISYSPSLFRSQNSWWNLRLARLSKRMSNLVRQSWELWHLQMMLQHWLTSSGINPTVGNETPPNFPIPFSFHRCFQRLFGAGRRSEQTPCHASFLPATLHKKSPPEVQWSQSVLPKDLSSSRRNEKKKVGVLNSHILLQCRFRISQHSDWKQVSF